SPDYSACADLTRCVELRVLDRFFFVPFFASAFAAYWVGGFIDARWPGVITAGQALVWWGVLRAIVPAMLMNATNFFCHDPRYGYRRFDSPDQTRNVRWLAMPTAGLAWHNNHHAYQHSARNGFFPGEIDTAWLFIRGLAALGLASGVRDVPPEVLAQGREANHHRGKPSAPPKSAREAA
ncbi:MAG: hypothetical protein KC620_23930, partial [Myxococcales bacterium]|nr:hypothetical protein [Myxococcales bacterium]